jgi:hypothetical protein
MQPDNFVTREQFAALERKLAQQDSVISELKLTRAQRAMRLMRTKKRLITATLFCFVGIPLLHAAVPHTFTAGTAAVASEVNANLTYLDEISVPVGGIIGWHKSFANVPALPASGKWVECNGQVLADAGSPLNGQTIPNLNGAAGGADSPGQAAKVAMFLRGGVTSGTGQTDAFQGWQAYADGAEGGYGISTNQYHPTSGPEQSFARFGSFQGAANRIRPGNDGTNGTPRTANETRPVNMTVVWIMRVK